MALPAQKAELERLYTSDEFEALPEFDERYELIDGRLVEKSMPGFEHGLIADILKETLRDFDPDRKLGLMLQEVSTRLDTKNTPLPDLSFWTTARMPKRTQGAAPFPDLAVEILSPHDLASRKRREEVQDKIRKYQAAGVRLVWVVNPREKTVETYYPDQVGPVQTLGIADELDGADVLPGFKMAVAKLFE